jgi:putative phosphoesterase
LKIGLISDIHGNLSALRQVMHELAAEGVEAVLNSGDNVGYSPMPNECIALLKKENVLGCMGNYDEAVAFNRPVCGCGESDDGEVTRMRLSSLNWTHNNTSQESKTYLSELPKKPEIIIAGVKILVIHGGIDAINERIEQNDDSKIKQIAERTTAEIIIMGHTHIPFYRKMSGKMFINPGSVGRPFDNDPRAAYGLLTINKGVQIELRRTTYDIEDNIKMLLAAGLPAGIGYALKNGREI